MGTEATQGIRRATPIVAQGDNGPAQPGARPKGVGQGNGAPVPPPPPPPVASESTPPSLTNSPEKIIAEANKKQPSYHVFHLTPDTTRGVLQHEYSIVASTGKQTQLATYGAGPCVIVAAWNPDTKKAGLAHVDSLTDIASVEAFINQVGSGRKEKTKIQVHLVGGDNTTIGMQAKLVTVVRNNPRLELVSADLGGGNGLAGFSIRSSGSDELMSGNSDFGGRSLAIRATTGEVFNFVYPSTIDAGRDSEIRLRLIALSTSVSPLHRVPEELFKTSEKTGK